MTDSWHRLLEYRLRARNWIERTVSLADTRLRVARLLDCGFDYGWDDVEADFAVLGHTADFLLRIGDVPWGIVIVRAMGSGLPAVPPPESYVMADGADVRWCWLTDGLAHQLYHVGQDLAVSRVLQCHVLDDDETDLHASWRLLCRAGVAGGGLERYRQERERPDVAAIRRALLAPEVLEALQTTLATEFARPGEPVDLAAIVASLCEPAPVAAMAVPDPEEDPVIDPGALCLPSGTGAEIDSLDTSEPAPDPAPAPAPVPPRQSLDLDDALSGEPAESVSPTPEPAATSDEVEGGPEVVRASLKRRRRGGWRLVDEEASSPTGDTTVDSPEQGSDGGLAIPALSGTRAPVPDVQTAAQDVPVHALAAAAPLALEPLQRPGDADGAACRLPDPVPSAARQTDEVPSAPAIAEPVAVAVRRTARSPGSRVPPVPQVATESILTTLERQRQTHDRLRQNLRDLRENRERLQEALAELQQDYPERYERKAASRNPEHQRSTIEAAKPASWTLLGHLQSLGSGYWEWCATDTVGPGVRLN